MPLATSVSCFSSITVLTFLITSLMTRVLRNYCFTFLSYLLAGQEGLEPPTAGFGARNAGQLSYCPSSVVKT